jgi:hypothetical protein
MVPAGLALCATGAFIVAIGAWRFLRNPSGEKANDQRYWTAWGSLLMGIGFILQLIERLTR